MRYLEEYGSAQTFLTLLLLSSANSRIKAPMSHNSPITTMFPAQYIIHIKDIIPILVIRSIIMHRLARFRQYPSRVIRPFVPELRVTQGVGLR